MFKRGLSAILAFTILISLFTAGSGITYAVYAGAAPEQPVIDKTATTINSISLSWPVAQGAASYNVYRSLNSNGPYIKINGSDIVSQNYVDTSLTPNTRYYYKVSAVSADGESTKSVGASGLTQPDFGPNVYVFDPSTPTADIQAASAAVFAKQETNQFGSERFAMLFKPGRSAQGLPTPASYNVNFKVGFYTQVSGLGQVPDDVTINGGVTVDANWAAAHNATQNFWRSIENLAVAPAGGDMKWAVSQAAPMRRLHVKGNLTLHDQGGWASGGFLADTVVDGTVNSGSQQQWFSRNGQWANWTGSLWNTTIVGSVNAPVEDWPTNAYTVVDKAPVIREKPFLTFDPAANQYNVLVPNVTTNTKGTSWASGSNSGTPASISLEKFYIADPSTPVASINAALDQGKNLLLTPGVYHLADTIKVTKPDTVVLGLGLATLHSDNGIVALSVADVDGVKIAGLLFEAGSVSSPVLLQLGPKGSSANHAGNPSSLHDLFFRVGGDALAKAEVCIEINSNNVIGDHFWVWRADHGTGAAWDSNITTNGMVVNGNDVTIYGLFVEHFHEYQTLWNGDRGKMFFYQTEIPYDVPDQKSWMSSGGTVNGYASYKVADSVNSHDAYGLGIYSFFRDAEVKLESGIEVPDKEDVKIHHATSVFLSGFGEITHIVNAMGSTVRKGAMRTTLADYIPRSVASIPAVNVSTVAGKAPILPAFVTQVFEDATTKQAAVVWETIPPSRYASAGRFTVNGTVPGSSLQAVATVAVAAAPNHAVTDILITGAGNAKTITAPEGTLQMSATVTPANADNGAVTWSVVNSNGTATDIATISSGGLLTAVKNGTVKVIATANDGSGVQGEAFILISGQIVKVAGITVTGASNATTITTKGATLQMSAAVQPSDANIITVTWGVYQPDGTATDRATISSSGLLTSVKDGIVKVVATAADGTGTSGAQMITISGQTIMLESGWSWVRETPSNWAVDRSNGNIMKLKTLNGSWTQTGKPSNILVRDPGTTEFTISTKLKFAPDANYEWAGLIIYQDDGKFITLGRQTTGNTTTQKIRFSKGESNPTLAQLDKDYADSSLTPTPDVYLKIVKTGNSYTGYYGYDGMSWTTTADTFSFATPMSSPKVGIFVRKLTTSSVKTAEFSDFKLANTLVPFWNPITSIAVAGAEGTTAITAKGGILQISATILPATADNKMLTWSLANSDNSATDKATLSANGLLTAMKNGKVKVTAAANDGSGAIGSVIIDLSGQVLTPPTIRTVTSGDGHVIIGWRPMEGTVSYSVYQRTADGVYGAALSTVSGNVYSYDATDLVNGTTYYYVLKAVYPGGTSDASHEVSGTPQVSAPGAPELRAAAAGDGHVNLEWNSVAGSTGYQVFIGTASGIYSNAPLISVSGSVYSYEAAGLMNGTTYYFVVKAVNPGGISEASNEVSATPQAPVLNTAVTGVTLNQSTLHLTRGDSGVLTASVLPANATNPDVTWTTSNANIAAVDANGRVTAAAAGSAIITVTTADGGFTATCIVTVYEQTSSGRSERSTETSTGTTTTANNNTGIMTITNQQLTNSLNGKTVVEIPSHISEIRLPWNTAELINLNQLEIKSEALTLSIPSNVFTQLTSKLSRDEVKGAMLTLKLDQLAEANAKELIQQSNRISNADNRLVGTVYEFHLYIQTSDGKMVELSKFDKPILLELKVPAAMNPQLAGIYYIADDGKLEYVGGTYSHGVITAEISHFSKYAVLEAGKTFTDVPSTHWASAVIMELAAKQIVNGTSATTFEPERSVTRAEFTALLVRALKLTDQSATTFADVKFSDWYADAVAIAVKAGIVQGKSATVFDANALVTREEMVTLLVRAYEYKNGKVVSQAVHAFADEAQVSSWAAEFIQKAAALNLIQGRAADRFEPQSISTRAEAAQILFNLLTAGLKQ
ncbi:Ig-like domain-containing protein [Paenibacillus alba]|uniref:Ig-like domain-containing protein n=1 Tax=Paenibacillus alba TaxID=1197127 RepID=UPI001565F5F7|nr:Ig-like domain-containing protein [Paenibacillus alba]